MQSLKWFYKTHNPYIFYVYSHIEIQPWHAARAFFAIKHGQTPVDHVYQYECVCYWPSATNGRRFYFWVIMGQDQPLTCYKRHRGGIEE